MAYPAKTTDGETVTIVEKRVLSGEAAHSSTILVAEDGRTFAPARQGGLIEEITAIIEEGVEAVTEAVGDAADQLKDAGAELVDEAKEKAEEVLDEVKDRLGMDDDTESEETPAA